MAMKFLFKYQCVEASNPVLTYINLFKFIGSKFPYTQDLYITLKIKFILGFYAPTLCLGNKSAVVEVYEVI